MQIRWVKFRKESWSKRVWSAEKRKAAEENTLCPLLSMGACFAGEFECYKVKYDFFQIVAVK
jgi:hypothetical protein